MTGNIYMSTVMASMELINSETPLMVVDHQTLTLEDVTDMEIAGIHLKKEYLLCSCSRVLSM